MALSKLRDWTLGGDGAFRCPIQMLEDLGATRAMLTTDDGVCQGYAHADGRLWCGPLVTPNAGKVTADAAAATAAAADVTKMNLAKATVAAQVARVQAIPLGSRSDQDKWLLALSFIVLKQE